MNQPFYLLSNASADIFPDNTLTEFKNVFPRTLHFQEKDKWEVGIESIGLSSMFRNVEVPNAGVPVCFANHTETKMNLFRQSPVIDATLDLYFPYNFNLKKGVTMYTEMIDKFYTKADVYSMCRLFNAKLKPYCQFDFDGEVMKISFLDHYKQNYPGSWVFFHETFMHSFKFKRYEVKQLSMLKTDPTKNSNTVSLVEIGNNLHIERKVIVDDEVYFGYLLTRDATRPYHGPLVSEKIDLYHHDMLPEIIKVQCDIIEPQIINNTFSQDLLVLSTDVQYTNNYYFHEIERVSYVPLLINDISQIKITLVDQNDKKLQLLKGHATIIKLKFKRNKMAIDNFYVRVTSKPSFIYPNNTTSVFSIQLPSTKVLDDNYKVSLNSINIPNKFTTFICKDERLRSFVYKTGTAPSIPLIFSQNVCYTPNSIVAEINAFLSTHNKGEAKIDHLGRLVINTKEECVLAIGFDVANVLGYQTGLISPKSVAYDNKYMFIKSFSENPPNVIVFESPINVNYYRPNYFVVYSNIVQPSIIGNMFSPILKIVPIVDAKEAYKLHDFKIREFYNIPNSDVNEIKMEIRTHDGELVNFVSDQHIVMNLQFTNEINPS